MFVLAGIGLGGWIADGFPKITHVLFAEQKAYLTQDKTLLKHYETQNVKSLDWESLLPESEKTRLQKYQQITPKQTETVGDMASQILLSIQASADKEYQSAMYSVNTVEAFNNKAVSVAGFVVPIEFHPDKTPSLVFIVPYYGACIHFPPPPPNQIIFARLAPDFELADLQQAYRFNGVLQTGLFEDPMGTSAYEMEVVSIATFSGEPDDFRTH